MHLDSKQWFRLRNTLLGCIGGLLKCLVLVYAYWAGYCILSSLELITYLIFFWLVCVGFVGTIVSGFNLHFRDPSLGVPQMLWAMGTSFYAMTVITDLQELLYLLMFTVIVYGIFRLRGQQFIQFCGTAALGFAGVQLYSYFQFGGKPWDYVITWVMFSFCVGSLTFLCILLSQLREKLKQKNRDLSHALEVKSQFLANMSHEIRTPMNGVLGMLKILRQSNLPGEQLRYAHIAESSAMSLLNVINDVLDLSKIEAGKLSLEAIAFDPGEEIIESVAVFAVAAMDKGLQLRVELAAGFPPLVVGDPGRLRQIINNLLGNAIKFTERGEVCVQAVMQARDSDGYQLKLKVRDTGIGLAPDQREELFAPFVQADTTTTRLYGGTGLGLTIVKHLCELMQGGIRVDSEAGHGSSFECRLCLSQASTQAMDKTAAQSPTWAIDRSQDTSLDLNDLLPSSDDLPSTSKGMDFQLTQESKNTQSILGKILLVEDNPTNQQVATILLEDFGCQLRVADNGEAALDVLRVEPEPFELILMDCQMPVMDGYQCTAEIRAGSAGEYYCAVPIIAMTAHAMKGDREKCLAALMNDYISKPIDPDALYKILQHWLGLPEQTQCNEFETRDATTTPENSVWNREQFSQRLKNRHDRMQRLITIFLEDLPERTQAILHAIDSNDCETIRELAHGLKGSSANMGADVLNATMANIEKLMREGGQLPRDIQHTIQDNVIALDKTLREFVERLPH